jgi:SAM-dependent methyltransferase
MRRQDWAFLGAIGGLVAAGVALLVASTLWAGALVLAVVLLAVAARQWSRSQPGPMSHALSWVLRLPRGPHAPSRLTRILEPRPGQRILEVGPGIGIHALPIAKAIEPRGTLDAIDIQEAMIRDLSARAEAAGVGNIVPACGDATTLAYADATFDAAFLITVLGEIPDQDAALRELRRVIKPSGRLIIGEMIIDPDFVALKELRDRAARAGFVFERKSGPSVAYLARFRRG